MEDVVGCQVDDTKLARGDKLPKDNVDIGSPGAIVPFLPSSGARVEAPIHVRSLAASFPTDSTVDHIDVNAASAPHRLH